MILYGKDKNEEVVVLTCACSGCGIVQFKRIKFSSGPEFYLEFFDGIKREELKKVRMCHQIHRKEIENLINALKINDKKKVEVLFGETKIVDKYSSRYRFSIEKLSEDCYELTVFLEKITKKGVKNAADIFITGKKSMKELMEKLEILLHKKKK